MLNLIYNYATTIPISLLLGLGLAMDAFGVSITHGIDDDSVSAKKAIIIALTFGVFQGIMPLIGYFIIYGFGKIPGFEMMFSQIIPPVSLLILSFLGIKMIVEYKKDGQEAIKKEKKAFFVILLFEGIATSIDALSSGLAMNDYTFNEMGIGISIIFTITFIMCLLGVLLGKQFGHKLGKKGLLIGGIILIVVGAFIFVKGEIKANAAEIIPPWLEAIL